VRRFLFKIRDIPTKTKGKKSDPWRRFFYQVKKATIVPLFLPFRFFYRVSAFFTCTFFGIVRVNFFTEQCTNAHIQPHVHTTLCPLCVLLLKFADMTLTLLIKFANMFEK
jgi:hypothetical protein